LGTPRPVEGADVTVRAVPRVAVAAAVTTRTDLPPAEQVAEAAVYIMQSVARAGLVADRALLVITGPEQRQDVAAAMGDALAEAEIEVTSGRVGARHAHGRRVADLRRATQWPGRGPGNL
jgi:hypothetical protein